MVATADPPHVEAKPRTELLGKLLARALDPECPLPEAESSALKLVHIARSDQIGFRDLSISLAPPPPRERRRRRERQRAPQPPPACELMLRFGRYDGWTLAEVARENISYLKWLATDFNGDHIRGAAATVLHWFTGEAA